MKIINKLESEQYPVSLSVHGGFFKAKMRWKDYVFGIKSTNSKVDIMRVNAVRHYILDNQIKNLQYNKFEDICLLFDDNTVGVFTFRAWGDIVAATWAEKENTDYSYVMFVGGVGL